MTELEKQEEREDNIFYCSECNNGVLIKDYERAELICKNCGLVIKDHLIDTGPEWRAFDQEQREKRVRVGGPTTYTMHDKGLSTVIDWRNKDSQGKELTPRKRAQIYRLRMWQRRVRVADPFERNLAFALSEVGRMSSNLGLSQNVREETAIIYRKAVERRLIRGRSIEGVVAASLYAACRKCKIPRTLDEIAEISRVEKKEIGRSYRFIARELEIEIPPINPMDFLPRLSNALNLPGLVQKKAIELLQKAYEKGLTSGRGPSGLAAAVMYISSILLNERRTQREVSEAAGVTEVTIRNRYKELVEKLKLEVDI
ncbi:MAG: transcription initiation factor IIB [Candidatus Jordarchaeum sp.]|uniref:transcription initiation factor IIB n=1 Tax=Candidatus Jordarchaeum sp. TaxID=2823881 RepID=UPI0040497F44